MPYLKDCIVINKDSYAKVFSFAFIGNLLITGLDATGKPVQTFDKYSRELEGYEGTPISDRDYHLAIARAKALQNNQK